MSDPIPFGPTLLEVESASLVRQADAPAEAASLLLAQFGDKPRLVAVVRGLADGAQDLEDALWQLYSERWIPTASGVQLDGIGTVVDLPRRARGDEVYRAFLAARILVLRSNGTWRALVAVLEALAVELASVLYLPDFPAAFVARLDDGLPDDVTGPDVFELLEDAKAGGVRLLVEYPAAGETSASSFRFESGSVTVELGTDTGDTLATDTGAILGASVPGAGTLGAGYGNTNDPATGGYYGGAAASSEAA